MEHRPGRKAEAAAGDRRAPAGAGPGGVSAGRAGGVAPALGRGLGFVLLAGAGLGLLAGVVLVPAWADAQRADYERGCLAAEIADARAHSRALGRLADALEAGRDETLVQRHLARYLNLRPPGHALPVSPAWAGNGPAGAPDEPSAARGGRAPAATAEAVVLYEPHPRPPPPSPRVQALAARLQRPALRRGLLLLAALAIAASLLLFPPPRARLAPSRV